MARVANGPERGRRRARKPAQGEAAGAPERQPSGGPETQPVKLAHAVIEAMLCLSMVEEEFAALEWATTTLENIDGHLRGCSALERDALRQALAELIKSEKRGYRRKKVLDFYKDFLREVDEELLEAKARRPTR